MKQDIAHEIWAAAQLMPDEGIEDGVRRIEDVLKDADMFTIKRIEKYEKLLFEMGAMHNAPCFKCNYNGPEYFNPKIHKCAEKHHKLLGKY